MLTNPNDWPADAAFGQAVKCLSPDRLLPVLQKLLASEDNGVQRVPTTCRVIEALYDPGDQVRIAYVVFNDDDSGTRRVWPDGDVCYVRYPVRESTSRRGMVAKVDGTEFELYFFPNDRRLRGLRKFAKRDRAAAVWQRWLADDEPGLELLPETLRRSLLRYVPEQKWIVHLHARCYDPMEGKEVKRAIAVRSASVKSCKNIYSRLVAMRRARNQIDGLFRVPKPVAMDVDLGILALRWAWGDSLIELLGKHDIQEIMHCVTTGLHALHRTPIENLSAWSLDHDLRAAQLAADNIASVLPMHRPMLDTILAHLSRSAPKLATHQMKTVHGDFYWNQLRGRSDRLTVLDIERCALGNPFMDVAMFATQLTILSDRSEFDIPKSVCNLWTQAFLSAWETTSGEPINTASVRWYTAVSLLTLARGALRHLRPGWPTLVETYLARAAEASETRDDLEVLT